MSKDLELLRFNMVEQQIRPWEVLDQKVLSLLFEVKREDFIADKYKAMAFVDMEIPLGHGQFMLAPKLEARLIQSAQIQSTDKVLIVGTGSGYATALAAKQAHVVYSVDIIPEFHQTAQANLAKYGFHNVMLETGDASKGWSHHAPYDVIILMGSIPILHDGFQKDLNVGGRLVVIEGDDPVMTAKLITHVSNGVFNSQDLFETSILPLAHALQPERFVF